MDMVSEVCCKVKVHAWLLVFPQDKPKSPTTRRSSHLDVVLSLSLNHSCNHQNVAEGTSEARQGQAHWNAHWGLGPGAWGLEPELPPGGEVLQSAVPSQPSSQRPQVKQKPVSAAL